MVRRLAADPAYCGLLKARLLSRGLHQTSVLTAFDRYPEIFTECATILTNQVDACVLSFGCSTGEEVSTLRQYFPNAEIFGTDLNSHNLRKCRELPADPKSKFFRSTDENIRRHAPYDAIFCMAVLQRLPMVVEEKNIQDISSLYPFRKFEQQLVRLDSTLKAGGLLVIEHTFYRLADTVLAKTYTPSPFRPSEPSKVPKFNRGGHRVEVEKQPVIFIKN